jgi:hypothetical protein
MPEVSRIKVKVGLQSDGDSLDKAPAGWLRQDSFH